jgi:hypothetical protein
MSKRFLSGINVTGTATLNTVADAGSNTDKFLVLDASNNVSYRTAAELYADLGIGALPAAYTSTLKHEVKASQTIGKGQAVYVSSADGTNMIVSKASNVSEQFSSKTMGLLETSLVTNGKGNVITEGLLSGLNTNGANAGDPVWLGVDGALIFGLVNKPVAPAHLVFIGIVTRANANNGEIFVKVQNGFEMNELHNYLEGSVQNNEVIVYESSTSLYKPKTIPAILGYTPADDASVVRITGAQTVSGLKTFSASIIANIGVLLKNNAVSALNGYTAIGGSSNNGIELVFSPGGFTQSLLFQPSAAYSYTFPAATGTVALISDIPSLAGYVPNTRTLTINGTTYDLTANRAWTITTDASARSILRYVATANQTTFTISGGYTPGLTDVYRNGVKLDNTTDFTATNGTTIVLTNGASVNDVIEVYRYQTAFLANNALRTVTEFIATAGQTTFSVTYSSGLVDVFYNGSKLVSSEFTAGNGTTIVLNFPCNLNDSVAVHAYSYAVGAFTGQAQLNGTGFVKVSGTTVTYDNSTYLTTSSASSTYATISSLSSYLPLTGGILTSTTRMDGSGGTTDPITMIFNSGINRLLAPVLRLFGATNTSSNYVELFGLLATQNRTINFPDASGTVALTSNLSSYLPLSGGIITGNVELNGGTGTRTFTIQSNTSGDAVLQILAAGSNGGNITYKRSTSEIVFNNNAVDALKIGGSGAATFSSSVTASRLFTGGAGLRMTAFGTLSQTVSGEMTILGHNVVADQSAANTVTVLNNGWYSSMIKIYYNEGITFHTSEIVFSANAIYPMGSTERLRITNSGSLIIQRPSSGATLLVLSGSSSYGDTSTLGLCDGRSYIRSTVIAGTPNGDTDIIFATQGSGVIAERVRINTDGQTRFQSSVILTNGQINSLGTGGGGQPMYLNFAGNGTVYAGSSYAILYAGSDRRIKTDINDSESTLSKILSLTPRTFRYKERPEFINYGFIAQEVEEVMPEMVKTSEGITMCNGEEVENQKSIESYGLVWASILVKAIQEQQAQIEELKALIAAK